MAQSDPYSSPGEELVFFESVQISCRTAARRRALELALFLYGRQQKSSAILRCGREGMGLEGLLAGRHLHRRQQQAKFRGMLALSHIFVLFIRGDAQEMRALGRTLVLPAS